MYLVCDSKSSFLFLSVPHKYACLRGRQTCSAVQRNTSSETSSPLGFRAKATNLKSQPTLPSSSRGLQTWNSSETQRKLSAICDVDNDVDGDNADGVDSGDDCVADNDDDDDA